MVPVICNPQEVQQVKDALTKDPSNGGVGILHEPTGQVFLTPFDKVGGHKAFVRQLNLPEGDCKGFSIYRQPDGTFVPINVSELNGPQGQPGALHMPQAIFQTIDQALQDAGL